MALIDEIKKIDPKISIEEIDDYFIVKHPSFPFDYELAKEENEEDFVKRVRQLFNYKYTDGKSLHKKDEFEVLVTLGHSHEYIFYDEDYEIEASGYSEGDVYFSIGRMTDDFEYFLINTTDLDHFDSSNWKSLRIYNIETNQGIKNLAQYDTCSYIVQSIIFDLQHKYNIKVHTLDLKEIEEYEDIEIADSSDNLIENTTIELNQYDKDLLFYHNRALHMDESEFKYIAYFQVIECLFDEVYKYETIQDVKNIIKSNWFSPNSDDNIYSIIQIIERYHKEKNDRAKTKLVLDKYFKVDLHDEAYFLVNKEIIEILLSMQLINKKEDLRDTQKIANIIYDFRNKCTHSNRDFPVTNSTVTSENSLHQYISIIKKIAEKIIINYN